MKPGSISTFGLRRNAPEIVWTHYCFFMFFCFSPLLGYGMWVRLIGSECENHVLVGVSLVCGSLHFHFLHFSRFSPQLDSSAALAKIAAFAPFTLSPICYPCTPHW